MERLRDKKNEEITSSGSNNGFVHHIRAQSSKKKGLQENGVLYQSATPSQKSFTVTTFLSNYKKNEMSLPSQIDYKYSSLMHQLETPPSKASSLLNKLQTPVTILNSKTYSTGKKTRQPTSGKRVPSSESAARTQESATPQSVASGRMTRDSGRSPGKIFSFDKNGGPAGSSSLKEDGYSTLLKTGSDSHLKKPRKGDSADRKGAQGTGKAVKIVNNQNALIMNKFQSALSG